MKKLIALLLAAIMVLSLAACASSPAADQPANDQTTADTTTTEETKTEEKTEEKTEDTAASGDVEVVTYYCSIGAYLNTLQAEVANWNETTGKEKGVEIQIISDINDYTNNARALMQGGTFYDLVDPGTGAADWIVNGWLMDLNTIDNAELKDLIAGYEPYIQKGVNIQQGFCTHCLWKSFRSSSLSTSTCSRRTVLSCRRPGKTFITAPRSSPRTATAKSSATAGAPGRPV